MTCMKRNLNGLFLNKNQSGFLGYLQFGLLFSSFRKQETRMDFGPGET
jgi:hypothetical protein